MLETKQIFDITKTKVGDKISKVSIHNSYHGEDLYVREVNEQFIKLSNGQTVYPHQNLSEFIPTENMNNRRNIENMF